MSMLTEIPGWFAKTKAGQEEVRDIRAHEQQREQAAVAEINRILRAHIAELPGYDKAIEEASRQVAKAEAELAKKRKMWDAAVSAKNHAVALKGIRFREQRNKLPQPFFSRLTDFSRKCNDELAKLAAIKPPTDKPPTGKLVDTGSGRVPEVKVISMKPSYDARVASIRESRAIATYLLHEEYADLIREDMEVYLAELEAGWPEMKMELIRVGVE